MNYQKKRVVSQTETNQNTPLFLFSCKFLILTSSLLFALLFHGLRTSDLGPTSRAPVPASDAQTRSKATKPTVRTLIPNLVCCSALSQAFNKAILKFAVASRLQRDPLESPLQTGMHPHLIEEGLVISLETLRVALQPILQPAYPSKKKRWDGKMLIRA